MRLNTRISNNRTHYQANGGIPFGNGGKKTPRTTQNSLLNTVVPLILSLNQTSLLHLTAALRHKPPNYRLLSP